MQFYNFTYHAQFFIGRENYISPHIYLMFVNKLMRYTLQGERNGHKQVYCMIMKVRVVNKPSECVKVTQRCFICHRKMPFVFIGISTSK